MSFWKNLFGVSKKAEGLEPGLKETQIMEEPTNDLIVSPPDDLMIIKEDKKKGLNNPDIKKEILNNKDSP